MVLLMAGLKMEGIVKMEGFLNCRDHCIGYKVRCKVTGSLLWLGPSVCVCVSFQRGSQRESQDDCRCLPRPHDVLAVGG